MTLLFLQPDCSFDFGINYLYQYTVSFTHSSLTHNNEYLGFIKKKRINGLLTGDPILSRTWH